MEAETQKSIKKNKIDHFLEKYDQKREWDAKESYKKAQSADGLNADGGKNQSTGLSEASTSTVNHAQEAG